MTMHSRAEGSGDDRRSTLSASSFIALKDHKRAIEKTEDQIVQPRSFTTEVELRANVERAIRAIESAGSVIATLGGKTKSYEETIRDLNKTIADLKATRDGAAQNAVQAEALIQSGNERARLAEARAQSLEAQIRQLEQREKNTRENLERVMRVVDAAFGLPARAGESETERT